MPSIKPKIIVASHDPILAERRRDILEGAGFRVLPISNSTDVGPLCKKHRIRLVVLGHSLSPQQRRRIWHAAREHCTAPVLQLNEKGNSEIIDQHLYSPEVREDLADRVVALLRARH